MGQVCVTSQSVLRGEFALTNVEDVTTLTFEVSMDVSAGDERVVRGAEDEGSYEEVSGGGRAVLLG